jgi:hypothetical protein
MAVPYDACDKPSARAEYKQPDAAIVLTHLAYYHDGLTRKQVLETMHVLNRLPSDQGESEYQCVPALGAVWDGLQVRGVQDLVRNV